MKTSEAYEQHPLNPFIPPKSTILILGSFPPPREKWSMDFFYPNFCNDMWRIFGIIFFDNANYFISPKGKTFVKEKIIDFLIEKKIAIYDCAILIHRLKNNASDISLQVIQETDISTLLEKIPLCKTVVTTGQKATEIFLSQFPISNNKIGIGYPISFLHKGNNLSFWRMPSSSRAYPLNIYKKADYYRKIFIDTKKTRS